MHATTDREDFASVADRYRGELLAHCYRMLGSVHDAEELVQETYLRAWRYFADFEGRSSMRTWLYRIATNACLSALKSRGRRPLPSGLGRPVDDPEAPVTTLERPWLQPIPDSMLAGDPAGIVATREGTRLAFVAALQILPARQRAALILRDVLKWQSSEIAELLDTSAAAVNSMLQRARAEIARLDPAEEEFAEPTDPQRRALLDEYVTAIENADLSALTRLLREDAVLEMPPYPAWLVGREAIARFISANCPNLPGESRLVPTLANGQPAFANYRHGEAWSMDVLTVTGTGITRMVTFFDPDLFPLFGLPYLLSDVEKQPV